MEPIDAEQRLCGYCGDGSGRVTAGGCSSKSSGIAQTMVVLRKYSFYVQGEGGREQCTLLEGDKVLCFPRQGEMCLVRTGDNRAGYVPANILAQFRNREADRQRKVDRLLKRRTSDKCVTYNPAQTYKKLATFHSTPDIKKSFTFHAADKVTEKRAFPTPRKPKKDVICHACNLEIRQLCHSSCIACKRRPIYLPRAPSIDHFDGFQKPPNAHKNSAGVAESISNDDKENSEDIRCYCQIPGTETVKMEIPANTGTEIVKMEMVTNPDTKAVKTEMNERQSSYQSDYESGSDLDSGVYSYYENKFVACVSMTALHTNNV